MKTRYTYLPLCLIVLYVAFSLFLYEFGPFAWITYEPVVFWLLNFSYIFALIGGWKTGTTIKVSAIKKENQLYSKTLRLLRFAIPVNLCYEYLNALRRFQLQSLNPMLLIRALHNGVGNMGDAYNLYQSSVGISGNTAFGGIYLTLFSLVWEFISFNIVILSVIFFKNLNRFSKVTTITTLALIAVEYIATGTNIGIFRLLLIFIVLFLLRIIQSKKEGGKKRNTGSIAFIIFSVLMAIIMLTIFSIIMQSRGGINFWQYSNYNIGGIRIDNGSIFFKILPSSLHMLLISVTGYLTQGLYGFSLCLRVPWHFCYGIGHSTALMNLTKGATRAIRENTYQYRITQFGWEDGMRWHSMYSWIANDTSFFGVVIVMFTIGTLFCIAYRDSILTNNPFAKLIVYYFSLLSFFIPCNNQLFQSTYIMFSFITAMILWICTRGKGVISINCGAKHL